MTVPEQSRRRRVSGIPYPPWCEDLSDLPFLPHPYILPSIPRDLSSFIRGLATPGLSPVFEPDPHSPGPWCTKESPRTSLLFQCLEDLGEREKLFPFL